MRRSVHLVVLAVLVGCTAPDPAPVAEQNVAPPRVSEPLGALPPEVGEVLVLRSGCYGPCPVDITALHANGRVVYVGRANAPREGLHTGRVEPGQVAAVLQLARDQGYLDAAHDHEAPITDSATIFTSVVLDGRRHWVRNYGGAAPPEVVAVEEAALTLLESTRWDETPARFGAADACSQLGAAILARCEDDFSLAGTGSDCGHWLTVWDALGEDAQLDVDELRAICSRQLESLALEDVAPPVGRRLATTPGAECRKLGDRRLSPCRDSLARGEPGIHDCADRLRRMALVLSLLDDTDLTIERRVSASDSLCGLSRQ